ncbi:hydantoinase/oxoprolinase family protein [Streptomyces brasiliensis]|uniref:Methylhydantoinase n=1 Tax=Streptomyces brasiliensis TaxID=1954 RepID=A0A917P3Y7_9ACTN|nr:hydantoinase/oxoprolinase family protein [Streptomyces brasiliensis]GGJ60488.1 methylhydantoinase [Streptomyces brasiliensis]
MRRFRLGVDVGGTFTDGVALDLDTGELLRTKVSTTPEDQSTGVVNLLRTFDLDPADIVGFHHGATVGLNAVLTRSGAKTGLLCTSGFRDLLDVGQLYRPDGDDLYDPQWIRPHQDRPLVHRRYRREIAERLLDDGTVHEALDLDQAREDIEFLRDEGIESVAICLINAYADDAHEKALSRLVNELLPDAYVQVSSIQARAGEYKRTFSVVLDAYAGPAITTYLRNLRGRMRDAGYSGDLQIMQMSGGLRTLDSTIEDFPALTMGSGPVAGILGAEFYAGAALDDASLVCVDIGGTSTDIGFVANGRALVTDNWEADQGMPLGVATVDVTSIGAGGGSIIRVDDFGTLTVGPESAGAVPGPAAYGRGGTEPTVTDCYVLLGYVEPSLFLGGAMDLDREAALAAFEPLANRLETTPENVAQAAYDLVNRDIVNATRAKAFDRALDVRNYALFAYGGAGPLHAVATARGHGMRRVVVPYFPGGFSAFGMLTSRPKVEHVTPEMRSLAQIDPETLAMRYADLEQRATADLVRQGVDPSQVELERSIYVMYAGQSWDNRLPVPNGPIDQATLDGIRQATDEHYDHVYGYAAPELGVSVTTTAVTGHGPAPDLKLPKITTGCAEPVATAVKARGAAIFGGRKYADVPFFARSELLAGNRIDGPAVIDDELGTILVEPGCQAHVDAHATITIQW